MPTPAVSSSQWPALTVWGVVNAANLIQAAGFLSRIRTGSMGVNQNLGYVLIFLAVPSAAALVAHLRAGTSWLQWAGPTAYLAFVTLMVVVDYLHPVEFRSPQRAVILAPYLVLFFGAILLMGLPMFRLNRPLWVVTVGTTLLLLASMGAAMKQGVG